MGKIKGCKNHDPDNIWKFIKFPKDPDACWIWVGHLDKDGYGTIRYNEKQYKAHRFVFEYIMGEEIPKGLVSDHRCRNTGCVNPKHLEFVTNKENLKRGEHGNSNKDKTHCKYGHPFDKDNTFVRKNGSRECRKCIVIRTSVRRKKLQCLLQPKKN